MGFKEDEDFASYLTMGAHAAAAIAHDLEMCHGHKIVELERYARANKIWATKVKRMRLPDLLCVRCGRRFEAKGKTVLALRLSDSATPGREWWAGGMRPNDVFAFVRVSVEGTNAQVGQVVYTSLEALLAAKDAVIGEQRKAVSAGAEKAVSWPAWKSSCAGTVEEATPDEIVIRKADNGRLQRYRNHRKWPQWHLHLQVGQSFGPGDMIVSCVAPAAVDCAGEVWDWAADLESDRTDDRFAAIKAARWVNSGQADEALRAIARDPDADWRPSLEAAASLSIRDSSFFSDIVSHAMNGARDGEAMEAVFVLTELASREAAEALEAIASNATYPSEVRAAAVWGLGVGAACEPGRLVPFLADPDDFVALHASAALPTPMTAGIKAELQEWMGAGDVRQAASAAHALARGGEIEVLLQHSQAGTDTTRALALRALGDLPRQEVEPHIAGAEFCVMETLQTLWIREQDWLRGPLTDGGLDVLDRQRLRL